MNIILVHIGEDIPKHININLKHLVKVSSLPIWFVSGKDPEISGINFIQISKYLHDKRNCEFKNICWLDKYGLNGFWSYTMQRFFIIESFCNDHNINEFVHIENDVVIYEDPAKIPFSKYYTNKIGINPVGPKESSAAYMYCNNTALLVKLNNSFLDCLKLGERFKEVANTDMVNEMKMLCYLEKKNGYLKYLPLFPEDDLSKMLGGIFDSASWGQYVGGTPHGHKPGVKFAHHYLGMKPNHYSVEWESGHKIPYVKCSVKCKLYNLHIHSKELEKYV